MIINPLAIAGTLLKDLAPQIIQKIFPDKVHEQETQVKLAEIQQSELLPALSQQIQLMIAETQSDSWLTKNYRALSVLSLISVIVNKLMIAPYVGTEMPEIPLPVYEIMLTLIGISYILRSLVDKRK